jgi:putative transposase
MQDFQASPTSKPNSGMVLRVTQDGQTRFLRLTHVFETCIYAMWVGEPNEARTARRPQKFTRSALDNLVNTPNATWGQLLLPPAFLNVPPKGSIASETLERVWSLIKPLIVKLRDPRNLSRQRFSSLIKQHAKLAQCSATTLKRLILRFYYFGCLKTALLPLPTGSKPNQRVQKDSEAQPHRRGRQSVQAGKYGVNDFVVSADDVDDMARTYSEYCLHGTSTVSFAYDTYLKNDFQRRHPDEYAAYLQGQRSEPITLRQFRYYTTEAKALDDVTESDRAERRLSSKGMLQASSPGDITEVDATGGRIFLIQKGKSDKAAGKPNIYVAIDRWSRFITGIYVSLKPASYDELRYLLLVCMTSRKDRFGWMNVNITDDVWPYGRLSAVFVFDRGSEFLAESTKQAAADDLRIELTYLPPSRDAPPAAR